jgi:multiple sugar transport system substrate-binding protein
MKNLKKLGVVLLIVCFMIAFIGCSKASNQSGVGEVVSSGPEKLVLYTWTNDDIIRPMLIDSFNKDYAGKYVAEHVRLVNADTMTINTALASGEQVDVMTQWQSFDLRQRYDAGIYTGMKKFFDKDGLTYAGVYGDSTEKVYNFDGDYYGIPYGQQLISVYYNKKLFDQAGVPYPTSDWTWDDMREKAKLLTKGSGANKVYGAFFYLATYWDHIALQKLGPFVYYSPDFKSARFDSPEIKESLQYFYDVFMVDQTAMPMEEYNALQLSNTENAMKALYSDKFAMWMADDGLNLFLSDSYTGGNLPPGTDIGLVNMPRPKGHDGLISVTHGSTTSIPESSKNKDGAWILAKYMCIDRPDLFCAPKGMHPGFEYRNQEEALRFVTMLFKDRPGFDWQGAIDVTMLPRQKVNRDNTVVQGQPRINPLILANLSLVFNGEMTVDECLRDWKIKGDQYITEDLGFK